MKTSIRSFFHDPLTAMSNEGNISLIFSSNSEAFASELQEKIEEILQNY